MILRRYLVREVLITFAAVLATLMLVFVAGRLADFLATAAAGAFLVRMQGLAVWMRVRSDLEAGLVPGRQLVHGAMVLVGGALLLTPGFLTDAVGFLLMIPFVREGLRRLGNRFWQRRVIVME